MRRRTTPLTMAAKLSRMSRTAALMRKAGQDARNKAMQNAEAALKRDRGEEPEDEDYSL